MFTSLIADWEDRYQNTHEPITVDFRSLVGEAVSPERYTHLLHSYPAKLLPQIPYLFLRSPLVAPSREQVVVADPFCGSGTVLLEAALHGYRAVGADVNPLARLIATVKTRPISSSAIEDALAQVNLSLRSIKQSDPPSVVNIGLWYREETIIELAKLRRAISQIRSKSIREFMQVCLSVCARKVSLADPRTAVPVRINPSRKRQYGPHYAQLAKHLSDLQSIPVRERFNEIVTRNASRMQTLREVMPRSPSVRVFSNAIGLERQSSLGEVQLMITSPPYAGAQKYIRASSLSLGWLDMAYEGGLRALERKVIGREHFSSAEIGSLGQIGIPSADHFLAKVSEEYPLRSHIALAYLTEMEASLRSMYAILRPGGHLVLVTGPNTVCGQHFDTPGFLEILAIRTGFKTRFKLIDHIRSRGLMTKRNKTASMIASELVLCMWKPL